MSCRYYGVTIKELQIVFVTWRGNIVTQGPKPKEAGELMRCYRGRLIDELTYQTNYESIY